METEKMIKTTEQATGIDAFASAVKQKLEQAHPSCRVETHKVPKNNNQMRTSVVIRENGCNMTPAIYLEDFIEEYQNGKPLDEICREIMEIHQRMNTGGNLDISQIQDFSKVKEKICYKLINAGKNAARLDEVPHRSWQDLAVVYFVSVSIESVDAFSSIMIDNKMMRLWGVDENTLYEHACLNTQKLFKAKIMPISEVIRNISQGMANPEAEMPGGMPSAMDSEDMPPLYVATNDRQINGASVLLYDGLLEEFAKQTGGDFYILPSSIHETLFLHVQSDADGDGLLEMVRGVNECCLKPEEILSDSVYLYHAEDGSVTLVS